MRELRTRGRFAVAATMMAVLTGVAAACIPPPEPPSSTTTTSTSTTTTSTTTLPVLAAQCVDNTPDDRFADYFYTGEPDVVGNMQYHESLDGSCSGLRGPTLDYTAVFAAHYQQAEELCLALGGTGTSGTWKSQGWVAMGDDAWVCNAQP